MKKYKLYGVDSPFYRTFHSRYETDYDKQHYIQRSIFDELSSDELAVIEECNRNLEDL